MGGSLLAAQSQTHIHTPYINLSEAPANMAVLV